MTELLEALAAPRIILGPDGVTEVRVRPLNFNDLCTIEDRLGSVESLDLASVRNQRFVLSLALDMDEEEAGALLPITRAAQAGNFMRKVLEISGLISAEESGGPEQGGPDDPKNEEPPAGGKTKRNPGAGAS